MAFKLGCNCCSVPCHCHEQYCYQLTTPYFDYDGVMVRYAGGVDVPEWLPVLSPSPWIVPIGTPWGNTDLLPFHAPGIQGNSPYGWGDGTSTINGSRSGWYSEPWLDFECDFTLTQPTYNGTVSMTSHDEYYSFFFIGDVSPDSCLVDGYFTHYQFMVRTGTLSISGMGFGGIPVALTKTFDVTIRSGQEMYLMQFYAAGYDVDTPCFASLCDGRCGLYFARSWMYGGEPIMGCCPLFYPSNTMFYGQLPYNRVCMHPNQLFLSCEDRSVIAELWGCDDYVPPNDDEPPIGDDNPVATLSGTATVSTTNNEPPTGGGTKPYTHRLSGSAGVRIAKSGWTNIDEGGDDSSQLRLSGEATVTVKQNHYTFEPSGSLLREYFSEWVMPDFTATNTNGYDNRLFKQGFVGESGGVGQVIVVENETSFTHVASGKIIRHMGGVWLSVLGIGEES